MFKIFSFYKIAILMVVLLGGSFVWAQDTSVSRSLMEKYLIDYQNYTDFDKFQSQSEEAAVYELQVYSAIQNVMNGLEQDIFRLFYGYAEQKRFIVDHTRQRDFDWRRSEFDLVDYYRVIQHRSIVFLSSAYDLLIFLQDKYDEVQGGLPYVGVDEQSSFDLQVQIKTLMGICLFYMWGEDNLKKSLTTFTFLLGQNNTKTVFANTSESQERVFKYIIATYNILLETSVNLSRVEKDEYRSSVLYYKWKLVDLLNQDNADLKDYKLMRLTKNYYEVMPLDNSIFEEVYRPYVIRLYNLIKNEPALEDKLIHKFGEEFFSYQEINRNTDARYENNEFPIDASTE